MRRHVFSGGRPFSSVLEGIFGGISQPDIGLLFGELAASTSYEQFSSLVLQAQGSAGLMPFLELDLDYALGRIRSVGHHDGIVFAFSDDRGFPPMRRAPWRTGVA